MNEANKNKNQQEQSLVEVVFKTQLDAVDFLTSQGYKVSKSKFNRDFKAEKISKTQDGCFGRGALLSYASVHLDQEAKAEDKRSTAAAAQKLAADAELKTVQAERFRLKLQKEQGQLVLREDHERALAARAQFFKSEISDFGLRAGPELIALVGGDEGKLGELLEWWADKTAEWMDAWSQEREFGQVDDDQPVDLDQGGIL